jgi:hypothetical protein
MSMSPLPSEEVLEMSSSPAEGVVVRASASDVEVEVGVFASNIDIEAGAFASNVEVTGAGVITQPVEQNTEALDFCGLTVNVKSCIVSSVATALVVVLDVEALGVDLSGDPWFNINACCRTRELDFLAHDSAANWDLRNNFSTEMEVVCCFAATMTASGGF